MSKAGLVVVAFRKMQALPERKDGELYAKANKFEKGLNNFVTRTMKRSWAAFRNEFDEGQAFKKRAVIQLINVTAGGQKKMYGRWHSITEKTRQMKECRLIMTLFGTLNNSIKSVIDNAFIENRETQLKEKALLQLFRNLTGNMSECFKRWREANKVAKIEQAMDDKEKTALLKMLEGLLKNGRIARVREVIEKFKQNRKITDIQRNFLKRLLMSKAGLVVVAFRKMQALPERKDGELYAKANKFEKGLNNFVTRTMKRSWAAFRNEFDEGQAFKKRAVIQLINVTAGGQKKMYGRWHSITEKTRLMNECRLVTSLFGTLNNSIKSVIDNAFIENRETQLKEKALLQLFRNLTGNMSECFKRWREANKVAKIEQAMDDQQRKLPYSRCWKDSSRMVELPESEKSLRSSNRTERSPISRETSSRDSSCRRLDSS